MMAYHDNPAGRLHDILTDLRKSNPEASVFNGWARVLEQEENDLPSFFDALAAVYRLPGQIRDDVGAMDLDSDLYLRWQDDVDEALRAALELRAPLARVLDAYDSATLLSLEHCSDLLHRHRTAPALDDNAIDELEEEIEKFGALLQSAELPAQLREFLGQHLGAMKRGLRLVRVTGGAELQKALEAAVGAVVITSSAKDLEERPEGRRFLTILVRAASFISASNASYQIAERVIRSLSS